MFRKSVLTYHSENAGETTNEVHTQWSRIDFANGSYLPGLPRIGNARYN